MPERGEGLGFLSHDYSDLFRPLHGPLANKDPIELKPPYKAGKAPADALNSYYPIGVICAKIRVPGEKIAVDAIARSEYMKWAIVESLAESLGRMGKVKVKSEDILLCSGEIEILDVQMPYMGSSLWQFCEYRLDYRLRVKSADEGFKASKNVFMRMVEFEADFCKVLEFKFREIYHMTVMGLINKRFVLMDGKEIMDQVALFQAAQDNDTSKISALLDSGINVNAQQKPARFPASLVDEDTAFMMVTLGRTALLAAAEEGHVEAMRLLLDAKADVGFQDTSGFHALYLAAGAPEDAEKAVNLLLAWGANSRLPNSSGYTALHNACGSGEASGIKALLEDGADLNAKSKSGAAPIHAAVVNNQPTSLEVLKSFGANMDMPAFGGNTPVHEAVMQNNPDIIVKLLELNADINIESGPDHGFATPLKMATDRKKKKAMKKLQELGALDKIEHEYEDAADLDFEPVGGGEYVPRVKGRAA